MKETAEQYQGERDQTFVRKFDDRLWNYCLQQHREHWVGRQRGVPRGYYREGEIGWWFPTVWVNKFIDMYGHEFRSFVARKRERAT